jgi:hypothetical protein
MTKQEQNDIIIVQLADQLADQPNVQELVGKAYSEWFNQYAAMGMQVMLPPPPVQEEQGAA